MSEDGYPAKETFKPGVRAAEITRRVFLNRLRVDPNFQVFPGSIDPFFRYVDVPDERDYPTVFRLLVDAYWQLVLDGVIAPGTDGGDPSPPFFHLTDYGKEVIKDPEFQPHDSTAFLTQLEQSIPTPDTTVLAYLQESLHCFAKRTFVASTMMLGIASERAFLLVCESLHQSLNDPMEQTAFKTILDRFPIKPKLDWVTQKFVRIQTPKRPRGWPEDADIKSLGSSI